MSLDEPIRVVGLSEFEQREPELLDGLEDADPEQVFFERAYEALGAAVSLRCADEGGRTLDAEEAQLALERIGHVLRAVVVPYAEPARDVRGKPAETLPHALSDGLEGLEACGLAISVDADAFGGEVIDGDEHGDLALAGDRGSQIGPPHGVDGVGDDGTVMAAGSAGRADARWREQVVLAHQPQHASSGGAHAADTHSSPDLAIAFAVKGTFGEDGLNSINEPSADAEQFHQK